MFKFTQFFMLAFLVSACGNSTATTTASENPEVSKSSPQALEVDKDKEDNKDEVTDIETVIDSIKIRKSSHNLSWTEACSLDNQTLKSLLQEVDDTDLQTEVFKLAVHLIAADEYISEKEFFVLRAMSTQWNIDHRAILQHNQRSTLSQEQQSVVALSLTS